MKGAIGNAFILNMVITFIIIFYVLLIGAVAYSKAYKTNTFLMTSLVSFDEVYGGFLNTRFFELSDNDDLMTNSDIFIVEKSDNSVAEGDKTYFVDRVETWNKIVNPYLGKVGYIINSSSESTCPVDDKVTDDGKYTIIRNNKNGYDYCIYINVLYDSYVSELAKKNVDPYIERKYMYKVISYMKFDFPIIGEFIKLPIVSESKVIIKFR